MEKEEEEIPSLEKKLKSLVAILKQMQAVLIAYSGGIDSSLLLKVARQTLGENVIAVTANSPIYSQEELRFARRITAIWGIRHKIVKIPHLKNSKFVKNPANRCYYCKREMFRRLWSIAREFKINFVLDGSNASDSKDTRPGNQAKRDFKVRSPLEECGINKHDIYQLSRMFNLPTRDKPATVCFASRIPYGQRILRKDLKMIEQAENYVRRLGFNQVRLRHYNLSSAKDSRLKRRHSLKVDQLKLARLEVDKSDIPRLVNLYQNQIISNFKRLGYDYVALDLEGYRPGSLNR